jgi:hypothetical protein
LEVLVALLILRPLKTMMRLTLLRAFFPRLLGLGLMFFQRLFEA